MVKVKRFLLILPMLVCLLAIGNVNAANTTTNTANTTRLAGANIDVEDPVNQDELENNRVDLEIDCEETQQLFIPPIFGFCGISIAFGSGCGQDSNYSCFTAVQFCGGSLTMHTECALE